MPTYDYECTKCKHSFELSQRISDSPRKRCPKCRGKLVRIISGGGGVILRGNGFYATDYRSESYKKAAKAESSESGSSPKKSGDAKKD